MTKRREAAATATVMMTAIAAVLLALLRDPMLLRVRLLVRDPLVLPGRTAEGGLAEATMMLQKMVQILKLASGSR